MTARKTKRSAKKTRPRASTRVSPPPASRKIRIVIADDQPIDSRGLSALLQSVPDFEVVAECTRAEETALKCAELHPSLVILALRLPASEEVTALSVIRARSPQVPILAVAERGEGQCMVLNPPRGAAVSPRPSEWDCDSGTDCLQLAVFEGASGTIRRSARPEDLFLAIRAVASGQGWFEAGTAASILRHALARGRTERAPHLSDRELEVAELIAHGRSNKEISQALSISEPTVKKHVGHILAKLRLQDRLQIGLYIARHPLILRRPSPGAASR
ncbi:MAG TPA: response regulator transcription factor [Candidatus Saccharimonadales bacterium]|nr:response regulator transcription factor [Candidatus Saccharimonadales bacterium]